MDVYKLIVLAIVVLSVVLQLVDVVQKKSKKTKEKQSLSAEDALRESESSDEEKESESGKLPGVLQSLLVDDGDEGEMNLVQAIRQASKKEKPAQREEKSEEQVEETEEAAFSAIDNAESAVQQGVVSYVGYEAGGGVVTELSYPLSAVPEEEGGEGLAAMRAEKIRELESTKLAQERQLNLGREVIADARRAMVATFILEPKFKRYRRYN